MCAAAGLPPTSPVQVKSTVKESPVSITARKPVAGEPLGGTSLRPLRVPLQEISARAEPPARIAPSRIVRNNVMCFMERNISRERGLVKHIDGGCEQAHVCEGPAYSDPS